MRSIGAVILLAALVGCRDEEPLRRADGTVFSSSGGEVRLADGGQLEFGVTSERYKQWDMAQRGLDRRIAARFGALLQPNSPTERSIDRAVAYLQSEPSARSAIERSGMSVRHFVLMTVVLAQEMRIASGRGEMPAPPMPAPVYPYPVDSTYIVPPVVSPPVTPVLPAPRMDSSPRPDTVFVSPRRDTIGRRDTAIVSPRRDTIVRSPDTLRRADTVRRPDTLSSPRPARDTARPIPPDTLSPR